MFTLTRPSGRRRAWRVPRAVRRVALPRPVSVITRSQTQRVALPQAPARLPSAFQKSSVKSAPVSPGRISASWSKPTPRLRSPSARASAGVVTAAPARESMTTKSLPAPCILRKRRPPGGGVWSMRGDIRPARGICQSGGILALDPGRAPPNQRPCRGPVAQLVEQLTFNQWVTGSNPVGLTTEPPEMSEVRASGGSAGGFPWRDGRCGGQVERVARLAEAGEAEVAERAAGGAERAGDGGGAVVEAPWLPQPQRRRAAARAAVRRWRRCQADGVCIAGERGGSRAGGEDVSRIRGARGGRGAAGSVAQRAKRLTTVRAGRPRARARARQRRRVGSSCASVAVEGLRGRPRGPALRPSGGSGGSGSGRRGTRGRRRGCRRGAGVAVDHGRRITGLKTREGWRCPSA